MYTWPNYTRNILMFSCINGITLCAILLLLILLLILYCDVHPCSVCRSYSFTLYTYSILLKDYATVHPFFCSWTFNLSPHLFFFFAFSTVAGNLLVTCLSVWISLGRGKAWSNPFLLRLLLEFIMKWSQSQCVMSVCVCEGLGQRVTL